MTMTFDEALTYLSPHPLTKGSLMMTADKMRAAVLALIKGPGSDADRGSRLLRLVEEFVAEHGITCPESIFQNDRVIEQATELIHSLVEVVGYAKMDDEDDEFS